MVPEREQLLAGRCIPNFRGGVLASGNDAFAVRAERYAPDPVGVSLEGEDRRLTGYFPHVHAMVPVPRDDALAVRAERDAEDLARMPVEGDDRLARRGVPDPDGRIEAAG